MSRWLTITRRLFILLIVGCLVLVIALEVWYQTLLPSTPREPIRQDLPPMIRGALWLEVGGGGRREMPLLYPFLVSALVPRDRFALSLPSRLALLEIGRLRESGQLQPERHLKYSLRSLAIATWYARHWTPSEGLETIASRVWLGDDRFGLSSGSNHYFQRPLRDLSPAQCALLMVIIQSPSTLDPACHPDRARSRRDRSLERMRNQGLVGPESLERAVAAPVEVSVPCAS